MDVRDVLSAFLPDEIIKKKRNTSIFILECFVSVRVVNLLDNDQTTTK